MPQPPNFAPTPDAAVGLQCPYCQTQMGAMELAAGCGDCGTTHHQECWIENQGCAVPGCESAPDPLAATAAAPAAEYAGATAGPSAPAGRISIPVDDAPRRGGLGRRTTPTVSVPTGLPPSPRSSRRPLVAIGVVVLVVAAVVGFLLSSGENSTTTANAPATCDSKPGSCTDRTVGGTPHSLTEAEVKREVQDLIRGYYGALMSGTEADRERARGMLSASEQARLDTDAAAASQWESQATRISDLLQDADAAQVVNVLNSLESSQSTGVARVQVTGMGWAESSCAGGNFAGVTWAQHVGDEATGTWRLDPNPSKEGRFTDGELDQALGATCLASAR
ncbi:MAG: hypothetical protein JHD16_01185 [Solirubrobacteraceae bacterium]|nr:hypothetical protein [Solirubrobacteraceae bacterium]